MKLFKIFDKGHPSQYTVCCHGSGGRASRPLITGLVVQYFNPSCPRGSVLVQDAILQFATDGLTSISVCVCVCVSVCVDG